MTKDHQEALLGKQTIQIALMAIHKWRETVARVEQGFRESPRFDVDTTNAIDELDALLKNYNLVKQALEKSGAEIAELKEKLCNPYDCKLLIKQQQANKKLKEQIEEIRKK